MITSTLGLVRFAFSLFFGFAVTLLFAGAEITRKNKNIAFLFCLLLLSVQATLWWFFGLDITSKLYPLITHVPAALMLTLYFGRPWLISIVSILSGYLCCQAPRWIGFLASAIFGSRRADHIFYIATGFLAYFFLQRYVAASVRLLMEKSYKSCLLLGGVPLLYYVFDYVTAVYTNLLFSGTEWAVQFMPSLVSIFYFVFIILYYAETQKQAGLERERDMLDAQFRLAQTEFASLRQLQQASLAYRHDMRHHLAFLQGLAASGRIDEISQYLNTVQSDIDAITPMRYCQNETVNLILSAYVGNARQAGITLTIDATLPDTLPFSDTELCSLLSNALENAIHACKQIPEKEKRIIHLRMFSKNTKLCIDIRNTYHYEPVISNGLPQTNQHGHGFGTKSIVHIVEKHGGVYRFFVKDGWFIFQATT